jgi:hypothetical protein
VFSRQLGSVELLLELLLEELLLLLENPLS